MWLALQCLQDATRVYAITERTSAARECDMLAASSILEVCNSIPTPQISCVKKKCQYVQ